MTEMSDQTTAAIAQPLTQPTRQQLAAQGRSAPGKVTGKLRKALDAMVWEGLPRKEAAAKAGLTEHGLYKALRKPPVRAAYLAECEVLRTSGRARRIHRLEEMVEQNDNKAAVVNASIALDRDMGVDESAGARMQAPGFVIVVNTGTSVTAHQHGNDAKPLIEQGISQSIGPITYGTD